MNPSNNSRLRVLLTRYSSGNKSISDMLISRGHIPIQLDTIRFRSPKDWSKVDPCLVRIRQFDWVVLTSSVGTRFFVHRMKKLRLRFPWKGKPRFAAVGRGTANTLEKFGFHVDFVPSEYLTERLAKELPIDQGKQVLLLRSSAARSTMSQIMIRRGFEVTERIIYTTESVVPRRNLNANDIDVITFASPSSVDSFCNALPKGQLDGFLRKRVICIGPVTAKEARKRGFVSVTYPQSHTFIDLIERMEELIQFGN
jgi:uroporphyrinogen-III synthase